jgi:hypothetical protein
MKTQHTKGEWILVYNKDNHAMIETVRVKAWEDNNLMGDYRGCIIADLTESHGFRKHAFAEANANARLIAAAPELLNACKTVLKCKTNQYGETPELSNDLRTIIESAIKKATE